MKIQYSNKRVEKQCENYAEARKMLGEPVATKLHAAIQFIIGAETLNDVRNYPPFKLHPLQGDRQGEFAVDLGRKLGWRLILIPLNQDGEPWKTKDIQIVYCLTKTIIVLEVTNHYE